MLICQGFAFNLVAPAQAQLKAAKAQTVTAQAPGQAVKTGTRGFNVKQAKVNVKALAEQEALAPAPVPPAEPRAVRPPKDVPENGQLPPGAKLIMSEEMSTPPSAGTEETEPNVPSPSPAVSFQALDDSLTVIPPDTMGAVGPNHVITTLNDRTRIQTRNGTIISTFTTDSFWDPLEPTIGYALNTFDPKIHYDRYTDRFIYTITANAQSANSAVLLAVSQTNDPTGDWNLYGADADATNANWADYPSIGYNGKWVVVQVNIFTNAANAFVRPDIYVFNKAQAMSGAALNFTKFTGVNTGQPGDITGGTWAPSIDADNASPNALYFVQNWNSTSALVRVSKLTGPLGSETITPGISFPQGTNAWVNAQTIINGGFAPQAGDTPPTPTTTRISTNDARMQNVVLRNGSLWATHTVHLTTPPLPPGTGASTANPSNHSGVQWWQINPAVETSAITSPLQFGRIEDTTATNCHNGAGGLIAGCTPQGTFFAFPTIAVNRHNDVLIGYSRFNPTYWATAAYSFRRRDDAANTMRDSATLKDGEGRYSKSAGGNVRWGDYSAAMTDPYNDRDFWTIQEYADSRANAGATSRWATWWGEILAPAGSGDLLISEFRLRGPNGANDEFIEIYNNSDAAQTVNADDGSAGYAVVASDGVTRCTIPNGTVIPARGHYLCVNAAGYSLAAYPAGNGTTATGDATYTTDIPDNAGIALFNTMTAANFTLANRLDAVGSTSEANTLYKEGTGFPALTPFSIDYSFYRSMDLTTGGRPKDTNNNAVDFLFVDTNGTSAGAGQRLGAPGPENLSSPINRTIQIPATTVDPGASASQPPNRVRDTTSDPANNSTFGTLDIRRKFTNNTNSNVTRLRFRIVDITTFPVPSGTADLRARSSTPVIVSLTGGGTATVQGTTLEEPPSQPNGGAYNSTLSAGTVTLATPLAPGQSINVRFLLGVQQTGNFRFLINVEALP